MTTRATGNRSAAWFDRRDSGLPYFPPPEDFLHSEELKHADFLILDARKPGIIGLELQTRVAETAWRLPIIFATGYDDEDTQRKALRSGAVAFLYKPFADEALFAAIHVALSQ